MPVSSVYKYSEFSNRLKADLKIFQKSSSKSWIQLAQRSVDGLASDELRRLVALEARRKYGAFFTPSTMAADVVRELFPSLGSSSIVYDPAVGAGNLLIATQDYFVANKIKTGQALLGTDIHSEFLSAARSRLAIKNLVLAAEKQEGPFRFNLKKMDGLNYNKFYQKATHIFVNPPFNLIPSPKDIDWSKGMVSSAALFIHRIIEFVRPGTTITAILPDVLRSGSRYHAWRGMVLDNCQNEKVMLLGQFDQFADVDVFGIRLKKRNSHYERNSRSNAFTPNLSANETIEKKFTVSVGTVVDNRDKHEGKRRGYIVSRGLPGWSLQTKFSRSRKHLGKAQQSPFIVIKRTSRMGDSYRAIATIINTPRPVYVDNHLIVLSPNSGTLSECESILANFRDPRTDEWLNNKIRCRHLTVKIVSKIPIWQ